MTTHARARILLAAIIGGSLNMAACDKKEEDAKTKEEEEEEAGTGTVAGSGSSTTSSTLTLSGSLAVESAALALAPALTDLVLYCISFEATPRSGTSAFDAAGAFSVTMPANINFGCFVNNATDNSVVGTFVVEGEESGMSSGAKTSMALSGSVDLGALTLGADGKVMIPAAKLETARYEAADTGLNLDEVHGAEYTMTCIDTGNAEQLAACKESIMDGGESATVFFRILKAVEDGQNITGMGVWASKAAFDACGGFDFGEGEEVAREGKTIEFTQGEIGPYVEDDTVCERRNTDDSFHSHNLRPYYALSELIKNGAGYSFRSEEHEVHNDGAPEGATNFCETTHVTAIEFVGASAEMYGAFAQEEVRQNCDGNTGIEAKYASFNVKFTKKQ